MAERQGVAITHTELRRGPAEEAGELALVRRDSWKRNAAAQNAAPKLNAQKTRRE